MDRDIDAMVNEALSASLKMPFYTAKKNSMDILKYTLEGSELLCNVANRLKTYENEETLASLEPLAKDFAIINTQINQYKHQLEEMEKLSNERKLKTSEIESMITNSMKLKGKFNPISHEIYKRYCEKAGIELDNDDEEFTVQESESTRSTICPVTQLPMKNPLRNPRCNHTYSEQGIQSHLKRSRKCPVAGCPQKLKFEDLERDVEMEVILEQSYSSGTQTFSHNESYIENEEHETMVE